MNVTYFWQWQNLCQIYLMQPDWLLDWNDEKAILDERDYI